MCNKARWMCFNNIYFGNNLTVFQFFFFFLLKLDLYKNNDLLLGLGKKKSIHHIESILLIKAQYQLKNAESII